MKKAFHQFVELVESNPLIYNKVHFDHIQASLIVWIFFGFQQKYWKLIWDLKSFSLVCRAHWDKSIDIQHIAIWSIFTPRYSVEYFLFSGPNFCFWAKILKPDLKFEKDFSLVCRAHWDESIDVKLITIWTIFTPLYSFEIFLYLGQKFENKNLKKTFH